MGKGSMLLVPCEQSRNEAYQRGEAAESDKTRQKRGSIVKAATTLGWGTVDCHSAPSGIGAGANKLGGIR